MPTVSVIIPTYNAAGTVADTLRSVREQTYRDHEVIVVDDASTDGTVASARELLPEARLVQLETNAGPAAARNRGIAEAAGEWIAFLDADDAWFPYTLEILMDLAVSHPAASMFCGRAVLVEGSRTDAKQEPEPAQAPGACSLEELAERNPIATSSVLIRRTTLKEAGGFDESFRGPEDYDLWLRVAARHRIMRTDAALCLYRHSAGSLSMDDRKFLPEVLRVLRKAWGPGGVLEGRAGRRKAEAYHCLSCSWMAANRGAVGRAFRLFGLSLLRWPFCFGPYHPLPWARTKLLCFFARRLLRKP